MICYKLKDIFSTELGTIKNEKSNIQISWDYKITVKEISLLDNYTIPKIDIDYWDFWLWKNCEVRLEVCLLTNVIRQTIDN